MKHRFVLHSLNHTLLCVDITSVGIPGGIISDAGDAETLPFIRFRTWGNAEQHFLGLAAKQEALHNAAESLKKNGVAVLTIT